MFCAENNKPVMDISTPGGLSRELAEAIDQANCQLCHAADSPVQVAEGAAAAIPHDMAGKENCAMCHAEGVMGATKTPANHGEIGQEKCTVCHTMGEKTM